MDIDKLIDYISQFDPKFISKIQGATPEEIKNLEELAALPLPQSYVTYLSRMGHNDEGLMVDKAVGKANIDKLVEEYEGLLEDEWLIATNCILIAIDFYPDGRYGFKIEGENEPSIWLVDDDIYDEYVSGSLEKHLWQKAFYRYRKKSLTYHGCWQKIGEPELKFAEDLLAEYGFEKHWFSESHRYCGEREDAAIMINHELSYTFNIFLGTEKESELEKLGQVFESRLSAENCN